MLSLAIPRLRSPLIHRHAAVFCGRLIRMSSPIKRKWANQNGKAYKKRKKLEAPVDGSHDAVLLADVKALVLGRSPGVVALKGSRIDTAPSEDPKPDTVLSDDSKPDNARSEEPEPGTAPSSSIPERWSEVEVRIAEVSSTGDGIGFVDDSDYVYVVPFTLSGELVKAKVVRNVEGRRYCHADLVEVIEPSPLRDLERVRCQYFGRCSGCQFQMLAYEEQLAHKRLVIEKAYRTFSGLKPELVPTVGEVVGSPLQYGYRTKLTPHFNLSKKDKQRPIEVPPIGYVEKGWQRIMDVEDCPIGTDAVRAGMRTERARVVREIDSFARGATLLLRESSELRPAADATNGSTSSATPAKYCVTHGPEKTREYVNDYVFEQPAGLFFQNNNSILPSFTQYIREKIVASGSDPPLTQLIDAYCGSGLFTVTLSSLFSKSFGIDIQPGVIEGARHNAELNNVQNATFMTATASAIFESLPEEIDPDRTAVVIDPPRKGCDADFLRQLLQFHPRRIVYVSCNCHTQARDIGVLVSDSQGGGRYKIESLRGFDFFPQTAHIESVAVLERVDSTNQ